MLSPCMLRNPNLLQASTPLYRPATMSSQTAEQPEAALASPSIRFVVVHDQDAGHSTEPLELTQENGLCVVRVSTAVYALSEVMRHMIEAGGETATPFSVTLWQKWANFAAHASLGIRWAEDFGLLVNLTEVRPTVSHSNVTAATSCLGRIRGGRHRAACMSIDPPCTSRPGTADRCKHCVNGQQSRSCTYA